VIRPYPEVIDYLQHVKDEQALNDFILWKKAEGKSGRTLKGFGYHIRSFFKCYPNVSLSKPVDLRRCITKYLAVLTWKVTSCINFK
jgi:hypothetical protein